MVIRSRLKRANNYERKLATGEEKDWAWDLIGMTPEERTKTMSEKVERWYAPKDVAKIKMAFVKLARGKS
jgi:hypothetical protein